MPRLRENVGGAARIQLQKPEFVGCGPMAELPNLHKIAAAQTLRMLTMQEAQLRELTERVRLQDELLEATVNALATICEQLPGDARRSLRSFAI